jgi:hypothetical protein
MAEKNRTHVFIDGRRVSFDRRDNSVTLFPDSDFRLIRAERIGYAEGSGRDWKATAPDGRTRHADGRKAAAKWLIDATKDERALRAARRNNADVDSRAALAEAMSIIHTVWPDEPPPQPFMGEQGADTFFIYTPQRMRDLVQALTARA